MEGLHLHGVHHAFDGTRVLDNVSLTVPAGELVCLLGPSGSGKTTLLRLAAGLEMLQEGQITIADEVVAEPGRQSAPEHRRVGYMFQDYALFPHLTILENVAFGLFRRPRPEARERALEMLGQVGMRDQADKHPHMLSGGQQQRVALARVLAPQPRLVLLDEPFSGLDINMRARIREETLNVLRQSGVATLMVTHDPEEAMFMADRIKVMGSQGRVLQAGRPADIYYKPVDEYVARLFGHMNKFEGVVENGGIASSFGQIASDGFEEGTAVRVLIRPEGLMLSNAEGGTEGTPVEIVSSHLLGNSSLVHCRFSAGENRGSDFQVRVAGTFDAAEMGQIRAHVDQRHVFLYGQA